MRFLLFVEGKTEGAVLAGFLKRGLDPRLTRPVKIQPVRFSGGAELVQEAPRRARLHLEGPGQDQILGVIRLLDFYGPDFYPADRHTPAERRAWAVQEFQARVGHPRFRMFFVVHEVEAWLLSDPSILPAAIRRDLPRVAPEAVNFSEPPSRLLERLYRLRLGRHYKKVTDGSNLFRQLDPDRCRAACPALADLLDGMETLARAAGL